MCILEETFGARAVLPPGSWNCLGWMDTSSPLVMLL